MSDAANMNIEDLSDDELMALEESSVPTQAAPVEPVEVVVDPGSEVVEQPTEVVTQPQETVDDLDDVSDDELDGKAPKETPKDEPVSKESPKGEETKTPEGKTTEEGKEGTPAPEAGNPPEINYEEAGKAVFAPFKANGKTMQIRSVDEAVRLMQMGVNYASKMQQINNYSKTGKLLEQNGLLDEGKLIKLIDASKGDKAAITSILKEANVDILDLDTNENQNYTPQTKPVSNQEMAFFSVVDEVTSTPQGKETIDHIEKNWDPVSKDKLFNQPDLLKIINDHRASGVFALITEEVEREKMLGMINPNVPFIEQYEYVGKKLLAARQARVQAQAPVPHTPVVQQPVPAPQAQASMPSGPIAQRVGTSTPPKPAVDPRVLQAAPTRTAPAQAQQPLTEDDMMDLPDDVFSQKFGNRGRI